MNVAVVSIQKNRAKWLPEWIIFHHLVGVNTFYIYLHNCSDNSLGVIQSLSKHFDIHTFICDWNDRAQIRAYHHAITNFNDSNDWLAFIDGDEFLFSSKEENIRGILESRTNDMSAGLCAHWAIFGSNNHIKEPNGYIIENYNRRAALNHHENKHIKTILKGRQTSLPMVCNTPHFFITERPLVDEIGREIESGISGFDPTHQIIRINHYATQSLQFYQEFKSVGSAMDFENLIQQRDVEWFNKMNCNDCVDDLILKYLPDIKSIYANLD